MYAIVESGGFQYSVNEGDVIRVPKIEAEAGTVQELEKVLMISGGDTPHIGRPFVEGAKVEAEVVGHGRYDKVNVFKFKRRVKYRRLRGHRQHYTELKVGRIVTP